MITGKELFGSTKSHKDRDSREIEHTPKTNIKKKKPTKKTQKKSQKVLCGIAGLSR